MIQNKVYSPIFIGFLILFLLFSCTTNLKENPEYKALLSKSESFFGEQKYDSAYYYYSKMKALCTKNNDNKSIIYPMIRMGGIQWLQGDLQGSEETFTEILPYLKDNPREDFSVAVNNGFGLIYSEQGNYDEAIKCYQKSLTISTDTLSKCIIKNNIAYNYIKQHNYSKAIALLNKIKDNDTLKIYTTDQARVLDNLGISYLKENNFNLSKAYLEKAKNLREEAKDSAELTSSYIHLAELNQKENLPLAIQNATYALQTATKVDNPDDRLEALSFLIQNQAENQSKKYALQYLKLNDSIKIVRQKAKNQFAKIKYDSKQALLEAKKQKQIKEYFIAGLICFLLFSLYSYYAIKKRNQKKLRETTYSTETRIAKKLHDELANDVHNTITFIDTQDLQNPQNKEQLLQNLDTIYNRTRNISNENSVVDTGAKYLENLKSMIVLYHNDYRNIITQFQHFLPEKINPEIKIILYRIVQELLVNMHKHSQATLVLLKIENTKKQLTITYSDNGIGTENNNFKKNGLQNAENRIFSLNGTITFDTNPEKGFKIHIKIPL